MAYTVKQLSKLSGVTVRTLHFYEEINLLKPSYYGANGYRYYEEKELLLLQQILFFKELKFTLKQIQKILGRSNFEQLAALYSHKKALTQEWEKIGKLIMTIDKTIQHLKGEKKMKDSEMFEGFYQWAKGKESNSYYIGHLDDSTDIEKIVLKNIKKQPDPKSLSKSYYENINKMAKKIWGKICQHMDKGLSPTSAQVQSLIHEHHVLTERFLYANKQVYKALAELYRNHPEYRKQLSSFHPKLAPFLSDAMDVFADHILT
jgi:DNA-binding transcriptional MerR regulator